MNAVAPTSYPLPARLQRALQAAPVVMLVSPLTDARPVSRWLKQRGVQFEQIELSMASAVSRDEFHQLQAATGWHGLPQIFIHGEFVGGIEEFFAHPEVSGLAEPESSPGVQRTAQWLGYLGALPFVTCAAVAVLAEGTVQAFGLQALLAYAAVILSFVGALHWTRGLEVEAAAAGMRLLAVSVLPALLAWLALLLPSPEGLLLLAAGFAVLYLFDRRAWATRRWFLRLRLHLSAAAVICLVTGAVAAALLT